MKLNFGENIKRLRKNRDLTQEALADALGITAQSVSKWECAYGYPDITQLPGIANYFGVTIDELLSNDEAGKEEANEYFEAHLMDYPLGSEERVGFILDYCRRYPDDVNYLSSLSANIVDHIICGCPENYEKYYPLLCQTTEKLLDDVLCRDFAVKNMIMACPEEDLDEWLEYAPFSQNRTRRNGLIARHAIRQEMEQEKQNIYLCNLETIAIQLDKRYPDLAGSAAKGVYHKAVLDMIATFGKNGEIPDGWLSFYSYKQLVYAGCLFDMGNSEDGKHEFISAIEKFKKHYSLTDKYLDMGASFFGGICVDKEWSYAKDQNGKIHKLYGTASIQWLGDVDTILMLLTAPQFQWFDNARNEDYYVKAVNWLESLKDE